MKKIAAILVPAALAAMVTAQPVAAQGDLNEREAAALARFAMPGALQAVQQRCAQALPADAYLYTRADALLGRLQAASAGSWPQARDVALRMLVQESPEMGSLLSQIPEQSLRPFAEELIAAALASRVESDKCSRIDRVLELVDPLPAENLAALVGYIVIEARKAEAENGE